MLAHNNCFDQFNELFLGAVMSFRAILKVVLFFFIGSMSLVVFAQQPGATVRGIIEDPDSALIPGASVTLAPNSGKALTTQSQSDGTYVLRNVPAGTYSMTVTMQGFASFAKVGLRITAGQSLTQDVKMALQTQSQVVQVTAQTAQVSVDQDSNASSTTIKGKDLDALSDDPDDLQSELTALAGPSAGPNGGQIYVDGFTGGQLPPKSSIREIRINQNPFSAEYDRLGYGRVEVFTKPGTDKLHGSFQMQGLDSALNTGNPLLNKFNTPGQPVQTQPPYHTIFVLGDFSGPLAKNASYTLSGSHRAIQDNSLVSAVVLTTVETCPDGQLSCPYSIASPTSQSRSDISQRVDLQIGEKNTLTTRFQYEQNDQNNQGVGALTLPGAGYNSSTSEATVQISDTQVVSSRIINETRFEFQRDSATQAAQSTSPTISVQGEFNSGGSNSGTSTDHQIHLEVQNYTSIQLNKNFIRLGGRLRTTRDANSTTEGENGSFTYNCLLTAGCSGGSSYQNGVVSQFSINQINRPVSATLADLGIYAEDDWKIQPNLTLSYGFRYETQNHLGDHHDFAPRVSFAYGLGHSKNAPKTVLRGGFGIFYDRFQLANVLTTIQQNGTNQIQTLVVNPGPNCTPTNISGCTGQSSGGNKTYSSASNLRSPYTMQFAIGVDQQLFRGATLSVNYLHAIGEHQFYSENINAPTLVNGQYVYPKPPVGSVPPAIEYQYLSGGIFRQNQLIANVNIRSSRIFSVFGYYALNFANADTGGPTSFPSTPYNIKADYGRAGFDTRYRVFMAGSLNLPRSISLSPFIIAFAGTPYNVTLGRDLNNDSVFNDRPAFLPGTSSASCTDASSFDANPGLDETRIPINYCTGPAQFSANVRLTKTFGFGRSIGSQAQGGGPSGGGPGGHGPGGHGGGHGGGPFGGGSNTGKRFNLSFGVQAMNLFNNLGVSTPNGTLSSQRFGVSTQLAGRPFTGTSAVRQIALQTRFTF
jgi:hypothetical protein